jgi:VWFA-related protein
MNPIRPGLAVTALSVAVAVGVSTRTFTAGQQQAQTLTFKAAATTVEVNLVAHDRRGEFVPNLKLDDLQLFEDGKPQAIDQFYLVTHERGGQPFPATGDNLAAAEDRARRVFVMLFDEAHMDAEGLMRAKAGANKFINENIGPGDVAGVYHANAMHGGVLTSSRAELQRALATVRPGFENRQALLATFREFPRIPSENDAIRIADGSLEVVNRIGVQVCRDDPSSCQQNGGVNQVENLIQQKARLYVRQARLMTANTLQNLRYVVNRLARIPGRKTVVFLSEGFLTEEARDEVMTIAGEAARGGSVIYVIDPRGLVGAPSATQDVLSQSMGRSTTFDTGDTGVMTLASATGGLRFRNIDDISRAFNLVVRDTSTYYVIGYRPTNPTMDGTYRKIEVRSRVSGLTIRSRQGYRAMELPPLEPIRR